MIDFFLRFPSDPLLSHLDSTMDETAIGHGIEILSQLFTKKASLNSSAITSSNFANKIFCGSKNPWNTKTIDNVWVKLRQVSFFLLLIPY